MTATIGTTATSAELAKEKVMASGGHGDDDTKTAHGGSDYNCARGDAHILNNLDNPRRIQNVNYLLRMCDFFVQQH